MSSVNKVILIGRVGGDPEIRSMQSGDEVANLSLATSEKWHDKKSGERRERTEWHKVTIWGGIVNIVKNYVKKGSQIYIEGQLQTRKWQDQNGSDRYSTEVVLKGFGSSLVLLGGGNNQPSSGQRNEYDQSPPAGLDDEIPF